MPTVAKAPANTTIYTEGQVFNFDENGSRQVSQAEEEALRRYVTNGGTVSIDFEESKKGSK